MEDRRRTKSRFLPDGWPDISGHWVGRDGRAVPLYIEVKRPKGLVSDEQLQFLERASNMGAIAFVATGIDTVIEVLGIGGGHGKERAGNVA